MNTAVTHLEDYDTRQRFQATVVASERITPEASDIEVRELTLEIQKPGFELDLGQNVGVLAPGAKAFGKEHHFRLYSVADLPERGPGGLARIKIVVRRTSYVDKYSGEEYPGVASNYLCDLAPGDSITMSGPYGLAFEVPEEMDADLILIGTGTGIAPFRAFVKHLYKNVPEWKGTITLFYGARSGLELLYMNDERDDFAQYYDTETFQAFKALSPRPAWSAPIDWEGALAQRGQELWKLLEQPNTYVYVAGLEKMRDELDEAFTEIAGSEDKWARRKAELVAGGRWVELLY
ncbi:MAG TPA: FAD-binding oxidoreductase [Polyangiales bacterium]|nr:FAD-binding oxidoreductase [Polyangiales bacterium]